MSVRPVDLIAVKTEDPVDENKGLLVVGHRIPMAVTVVTRQDIQNAESSPRAAIIIVIVAFVSIAIAIIVASVLFPDKR